MTISQPDPETISTQAIAAEELTDRLIEEATANNPVDVIQTVIASLDSDQTAMVSRNEGGHVWKFKYGSVEVFVQLTGLAEEDTLTVWAGVLKFPVKDEAQLMRQLLEMNWTTTLEARFAIFNDQVVVVASRTLADLSPGEISRAVTIVATIADDNDDALQAQFGAA